MNNAVPLRRCALSAHIGYLFTDVPLEARPAAARAAGFDAVEHPAPFAIAAPELRAILTDLGLGLAQITSGMGAAGEKGLASLPGREAEFRDGYARALDYAEEAGSPFVHAMAGVNGDDVTYRANIEAAMRMAEGRRPQVLIEAISHRAVSGYHLHRLSQLLQMGRDYPALRLLIDTYHATANNEDPLTAIAAAGGQLGHIHIADFPGRAEPGSGALDFTPLFAALKAADYAGAIGFEYIPSGDGHLGWMPSFLNDPALCALRNRRIP